MGGACFEKCLTGAPGTSLSRNETSCIPQCNEKYIAAWNVVNSTIISRLQRETQSKGGLSSSGFVDD